MALHIYRYRWHGISLRAVNRLIDEDKPAVITGFTLPPRDVDLQADSTTKEDLDSAMLEQGWDFVTTDPVFPLTLP